MNGFNWRNSPSQNSVAIRLQISRTRSRLDPMRILIATDAWTPQINGVVRTLKSVCAECTKHGHATLVVSPEQFSTFPCPTYPEIRLALNPLPRIAQMVARFEPDAVHIATEGPIGIATRRLMLRRKFPFTTSYHTRFPEYVAARFPVPASLGYAYLRWFHGPSRGMMVATESIRRELEGRGFGNLRRWSRGVDTAAFRPGLDRIVELPRPIFLYVGRVAVEKNLPAFLDLALPGSKLVVGDGPDIMALRKRYPAVSFAGARHGEELSRYYASADVFVFPSRTDTYGLVLLEALASGVPVAAFPVPGPLDVIGGTEVGVLDEDLGRAALRALEIPRKLCRAFAERMSWSACAEQFLGNLAWRA
jgi:glycosyltransferase involved in cell wall biosynthesis